MPSVRNVAIDNLKPLTERDDVGALWENFVLAERLKWLHYHQTLASLYFWRTLYRRRDRHRRGARGRDLRL